MSARELTPERVAALEEARQTAAELVSAISDHLSPHDRTAAAWVGARMRVEDDLARMAEALAALDMAPASAPAPREPFAARAVAWMLRCFGAGSTAVTLPRRTQRFTEEALELAQAAGLTEEEAHRLVRYVYKRPTGDVRLEVGGVLVTLAGVCYAAGVDLEEAGEAELARVEPLTDAIRAKDARKPEGSPLPGASAPGTSGALP